MYKLLARIPEGLGQLRARFETVIKTAGLAAVERIAGETPESVEPKAYVDAISSVHSKYLGFVKKSFRAQSGFRAALDKACRDFVNVNAISGKMSTRPPEFLARYADQLLKKTSKASEEADLDLGLVQIVCILSRLNPSPISIVF